MQLEGGHRYSIKVEYTQNGRGGGAELNWIPPASVLLANAEGVARESDVALVFVGLNGSQEGEGHDRSAIDLPQPQEDLVKAMIATGKPVVVVLTSGSAVAINSAAAGATAVLSAWYGERRPARPSRTRWLASITRRAAFRSRSTKAWIRCPSSPTTR